MPRPLRIEYQDAWYHVMNRGMNFQTIFQTSKHKEIFISLLSEAVEQFKIEIHAYCIMSNHYHLLIKTPYANLSRAMRHINGVYTQRYNRLEMRDGSLFSGRYKSIIIDKDAYLLQVSRYIHRNPTDLKSNYQLKKYQWSSYKHYINTEKVPSWLKTQEILSMLGQKNHYKHYKLYVESELDDDTVNFYKKKNIPIVFGRAKFKSKLLNELKQDQIRILLSDYKHTNDFPTVDEIIVTCSDLFRVSADKLCHVHRGMINEPRKIAMYACRAWGNHKLSEIALKFNCRAHSTVSNVVFEMKQRLEQEPGLKRKLKEVKTNLGLM